MTQKSFVFVVLMCVSTFVFAAVKAEPTTTPPSKTTKTVASSSKAELSPVQSDNDYSVDDDLGSQSTVNIDPYEHFNRDMFRFNEKLDTYILKPVATAYNDIVPKPIANSINRMFLNVENISNVANDLLQANFYQTISDTWRFMINSTVGVFGIFDPASVMGLQQNTQDFGLTLAKWGYKQSNYLVLPFWGPKTVRDTLAMPVDYYTDIYPYLKNVRLRNSLHVLDVVNTRAQLLKLQDVYDQMAIDKYVFIRNAYLQRRQYLEGRTKTMDDPYTKSDSDSLQEEDDYYYLDE